MGEKPTEADEQAERHVSAIKMPPEAPGQEERTTDLFLKLKDSAARTLDESSPELGSPGVIKMPPELAEDIPIKGEGGGSPSEKAAGEKGDPGSRSDVKEYKSKFLS